MPLSPRVAQCMLKHRLVSAVLSDFLKAVAHAFPLPAVCPLMAGWSGMECRVCDNMFALCYRRETQS
jgi:hypothetical protein